MRKRFHQSFRVWPLRLITISLSIIIVTFAVAPLSKVFILIAVGLGLIHSLSTIEELTGGREISLLSIPVLIVADVILKLFMFEATTIAQSAAIHLQFIAVIVLTESIIVFLLRSRLESFCAQKALK